MKNLASLLLERPIKSLSELLGKPAAPGSIEASTLGDILAQTIVPPTISLPIDPEVVSRAVQASAKEGQADFPMNRFVALLPAGGTISVPLYVRTGFVGITLRPIKLKCDYHTPLAVINVYIDDTKLATPYGLPLSEDIEIPTSQYWMCHYDLLITAVNASAHNILVTLDNQAGVIEKSLFETFYEPLLTYSKDLLAAVAEVVLLSKRGGGGVNA